MKTVSGLMRFLRDRSGGTAIEYGLIASLITIGLIGAMSYWGESTNDMYAGVSEAGWTTAEDEED